MRPRVLVFLAILVTVASSADARRVADTLSKSDITSPSGTELSLDRVMSPRFRSAMPGTTVLGSWDFDGAGCDAQGWTSHDITAQPGDFFHVDDFAGLGGGTFGRAVAIDGSQSMWCGARPDAGNYVLCSYATLPGYGNNWNQALCTKACLNVVGDVSIHFRITYDSEPGYDFSRLEFDDGCVDTWQSVHQSNPYYGWDGAYFDSSMTCVIPNANHGGSLRLRFHFTSDGAWSDQDGSWNTDGAVIIDNLGVDDAAGTVLATETFEDEAVGANDADDWESCTPPGYGDFAALYPGTMILSEDACVSNLSCMWTFFIGSTETYACGGFPEQLAIPKKNARHQYITNDIWSPVVPFVGSGSEVRYVYDVYMDMPLNNLVFYLWHVRSFFGGCPGQWKDRNFVQYGGTGQFHVIDRPIGDLIEPGAAEIQVALEAADFCGVWCGSFGTGACHSHSPMFDNVEVLRIDSNGPAFSVRDVDLFQDTFSDDGTISGTARADMANDITSYSSPTILPGDSCVVDVGDVEWGLASAPLMYVAVWPQGQPGKDASGIESADLTMTGGGPATRFPVVDSLVHGGATWYCVKMDTAWTDGFARTGAPPVGRYCVDLSDSTFTPCDTICFIFCAENTIGEKTYWTPFTGTTDDMSEALNAPAEFQVLPGGGWKNGGDILYVDNFDGRGAQPFFDTAFQVLGIEDQVDRYDRRAPTSFTTNGLGSRVKNVQNQILGCYRKIIWNSGDLSLGTIGDADAPQLKSPDTYILATFLDHVPNTGGVYFSGDDIATELLGLTSTDATTLRSYITYNLTSDDHAAWGGEINPLLTGVAGGCFDHITGPDEFIAYAHCTKTLGPLSVDGHIAVTPIEESFDVLTPTGTAQSEMQYPGGGVGGSAVISQSKLNLSGFTVGVILSGFSYNAIRDVSPGGDLARVHHLADILNWLDNSYGPGVGSDTPQSNGLSQNYPNPFNPVTNIDYSLIARGHVTLRVYNVAGQLVRTLIDESAAAGLYSIAWDGRSDNGSLVSSGVYFYKLVSGDFSMTRKMVLLK